MKYTVRYRATPAWILLLIIAGCSGIGHPNRPAAVQEIAPGFLKGYLAPEDLPDSLLLVPPPPAGGSAATALDREVSRECLVLRGTPRWDQATRDAELKFPEATEAFSDALGFQISETETPHLYLLLRRSLTDAGLSTFAAKKRYSRPRPFLENDQPICTPVDEEGLSKNGSYPSGHTAIGWAWALILCEIVPDQTDAILARGREFGQSRVVCNVHWQSDVIEGRVMGAAVVARLHAVPDFLADLDKAKAEAERIRTGKQDPPYRETGE